MATNRENLRTLTLMSIDAVLITVSFLIALQLALREIADIHYRWYEYLWMIVVQVAVKLAIYNQTGLYREVIKFASMEFAVKIVKSTVFGALVAATLIHVVRPEIGMSVLVVDWMANCILIGLSRFGMRYILEGRLKRVGGGKTILYGAGEHGATVARHMLRNSKMGYNILGFVDDDAGKHGKKIQGIPVLGASKDLESILKEHPVSDVVVTFAEAEGDLVKQLFRTCRENGVRCRIVPGMEDVITKSDFVRNIDIADLMRRPQRNLDKEMVGAFLRNRRILITGAAGSIGSEIFRQVLSYSPSAVAAIDHSEFGLYRLDEEMSSHPLKDRCVFSLVDVKSRDIVRSVVSAFRPDVIFHAAAYKHVPILEQDVKQAILNNVGGLQNLIDVAADCGTKMLVFISTDKAVRPTNVMGATKRVGELLVQNANSKNGMKCASVRFGNVLASSGSVIPKFIEQIKAGGPVTVTHPEVTRYFMLISEAVELVLQAASLSAGGEVFVLNMGKPVRISEMAEDLISLMGHVPHSGIPIEYSGLRPGEKLHEELFLDDIERTTQFKDIRIGKVQSVDEAFLKKALKGLFERVEKGDSRQIRLALKELVQEYTWTN